MLEIIDLHKSYGKFVALDGLTLEVKDSSIFGFVGPNGAGKTTTMKIVTGLLAASSGRVLVNGEDIAKQPKKLKEKMGYMPDFFGVYDNLKVNEYMDFYAGMHYIPIAQRKKLIGELLELVDLSDKMHSYVDGLSRGMKQRLCLARSLVHDPEILILDEPASGLDPRARVEMKEVLKQLRSLGKTVIISSHILPELAEMCDTIGIIDKGSLVTQGSVAEIMKSMNNHRIIYVKLIQETEPLINLLKEQPCVSNILEKTDEVEFGFDGDDCELSSLLKQIVTRDIKIMCFKEKEGNLEDVFMQLTVGGEQND